MVYKHWSIFEQSSRSDKMDCDRNYHSLPHSLPPIRFITKFKIPLFHRNFWNRHVSLFQMFFVAILRILGKPFPCFLSSLEGKLGVKCTDTEVLAALPPIRANGKPRESSNCTFWSWEVSRQDLMAWAAHGHSSPVLVVAKNFNYATNYGNGKSASNQLHFLVESKG